MFSRRRTNASGISLWVQHGVRAVVRYLRVVIGGLSTCRGIIWRNREGRNNAGFFKSRVRWWEGRHKQRQQQNGKYKVTASESRVWDDANNYVDVAKYGSSNTKHVDVVDPVLKTRFSCYEATVGADIATGVLFGGDGVGSGKEKYNSRNNREIGKNRIKQDRDGRISYRKGEFTIFQIKRKITRNIMLRGNSSLGALVAFYTFCQV